MTVQTVKLDGQEFILVAKRDFEKLRAQAERHLPKNGREAGNIAEVQRRKAPSVGKSHFELRKKLDETDGAESLRRLNDPKE